MDDHALLVDVLGAEAPPFAAAHAGGVERHEDGAVAEIGGCVGERGDFLGAEHEGDLPARLFRKRQVIAGVTLPQDLEGEEAKRGDLHHDRLGAKLTFFHRV
jgi:hypothetical protein